MTVPSFSIKNRINAFTIVELLVVIGIISVLAVALLVTLNPAEAQRRSRDAKRVKDANTIQALVEQHINDGGANICTTACVSTSTTSGNGAANSQPCTAGGANAGNWLGATSWCTLAKTVPADPINSAAATRACVGNTSTCTLQYRFMMNTAGDYEINVRQEATANGTKVTNDSGDSTQWMEIFSNAGTLMTD